MISKWELVDDDESFPVAQRVLRKTTEGRAQLLAEGRTLRRADIPRREDPDYLSKQFVAWDSEGITYHPGEPQAPVLFGNSLGYSIRGRELSTEAMLDLMLRTEHENPEAIHVGFAFNYDVNQILKDVGWAVIRRLRERGIARWKTYRLEYRPGKWFMVSRGEKGNRTVCRIFDVWGYFQGSFLSALEEYKFHQSEIEFVARGKAERGAFKFEDLDEFIVPYWEAELRFLVQLCEQLRSDLDSVGIRITSWHGPGSVANAVLRTNRVAEFMASAVDEEIPIEVNRAAQFAYAGGRFELFRAGQHDGKVWQYDINSAYPWGISQLPSLRGNRWVWREQFEGSVFGVWRVDFDARTHARNLASARYHTAMPLFRRDEKHCVSFPLAVSGWYWTPEASLARGSKLPARILGGWVLEEDDRSGEPFSFVAEMYAERKRLKAAGNGAQRALKLALNSLYGKMAQRAGYAQSGRIPKWHQLEWAGYVTSCTRAYLYQAMVQAMRKNSLIAVETDAIFSTEPLDLDIGSGLGQWEATEYDGILYLQSGVYFTDTSTGNPKAKYRGMDKGSYSYSDALAWLSNFDRNEFATLQGTNTRYRGMGIAFGKRDWRVWETAARGMEFGGGGKRIHIPSACPECINGISATESLHHLIVTPECGPSFPHVLPWLHGAEEKEAGWWQFDRESA